MEKLTQSLRQIQHTLKQAGIESAAIGALAVAVWGEPRVTRDVDLKIDLGRDEAPRLLDLLAAEYTPLFDDPLRQLRQAGMVFVQDSAGTRIDLLLADVSFDVEAVRRGREITFPDGAMARVCTAEDLIIYKLISTRERDHVDAETVVRWQRTLDLAYIRDWLGQFEQALDDSTLVETFEGMLQRRSPRE